MMSKRIWVAGAVLGVALANAGCVTYCHEGCAKVWDRGADHELSNSCRAQVHVFMVHGLTPSTGHGLRALRHKLNECGFAKVGAGELVSGFCIEHEIKKIHRCDPEAKFVLVGYDFGGSVANCIARDLAEKGVPVEAVVLLDPLNCGKPSGARTILVTSGTTPSTVAHTDRLVVPDSNHYRLPTHPSTVAAIKGLLQEIAAKCAQPPVDPVPVWQFPGAPEMRPLPVARGDQWDILAEQGGVPQPVGTRVESPTAPPPTSTSAGAVVVPR